MKNMNKQNMKKVRLSVPFSYDNKIIEKSTTRTYRNVPILHPGEYSDGYSRTMCYYSKDVVKKYAMNWDEKYLDIDHDVHKVLSRIGWVEPKGWDAKQNAVVADLKILPVTQNAKDTIALIDNKLIDSVSVEMYISDSWDDEKDMQRADEILFSGLGVVTHPSDNLARIKVV